MEFLKISQVSGCLLNKSPFAFSSSSSASSLANSTSEVLFEGSVHLTAHFLLFVSPSLELWLPFTCFLSVERKSSQVYSGVYYPLHLFCRDFSYYKLLVPSDSQARDIHVSILAILSSYCPSTLHLLPAFSLHSSVKYSRAFDGWSLYDPVAEYDRLGVGSIGNNWRLSQINSSFQLSMTYPRTLVVPTKISDAVLFHAAKFRSRGRLPCLTYLHASNNASITRSSQPLVGISMKRSIQDERLLECIFESGTNNLIIDARPLGNAMANRAMGAGTESMEYYKNCKRLFMGIDNIHVMRESLSKLTSDVILSPELQIDKHFNALDSSNWLKHIKTILESAVTIKDTIISGGNVLIHCSDGWDRTAQLSALASIMLSPHYRTIKGFEILIEKEWLSFGHKFSDRLGHFVHHYKAQGNMKKEQEISPVFLQFLECINHIMKQWPTQFQYNEQILIDIYRYCQTNEFGTFLLCCERERIENNLSRRTHSVWTHIEENLTNYLNPLYDSHNPQPILNISCAAKDVSLWVGMYCKNYDNELLDSTNVELKYWNDKYKQQSLIL